jgi:hypothetical protein
MTLRVPELMSFVTIDTLSDAGLAQFAQMRFEAEGIPVLMNSMGQAQLGFSPIVGGIRVEVPEEYAEQAIAILRQVKEDLGAT